MLNIVLVEPEIPQNTGNISRTCAATASALHLVKPLGFSIDESRVRRAGLDYWSMLELHVYDSLDDFLSRRDDKRMWFATTKADRCYSEAQYADDDYLVFGRETRGLPEHLLHPDRSVRIPIINGARSLNLSNSVAVIVFEALRQLDFPHLTRSSPSNFFGQGETK